MMTLGCGEARLERVPSARMIGSPEEMPRRPSSQLASMPWRLQAWASAALPATIAAIKIKTPASDRWSCCPSAG